jgi:hypothetical protein
MPEDYTACINCGERIERINFASGPEWRHWPTPYGNHRTREMYQFCKTQAVATPPGGADD